MPNLIVDVTAPHREPNELVIAGPGGTVVGWEGVAVTLRAEAFPNSFVASFSTLSGAGGNAARVADALKPGSECEVYLGDNLVLSGYVDGIRDNGGPDDHSLTITGRGKTCDLADCSAEYPGGMIQGASALEVITKLAAAYPGLVVEQDADVPRGDPILPYLVNYGEPAADMVQRIAHSAGLMAYETERGTLKLTRAGSAVAASQVAYGVNVERYEVSSDVSDRFSELVCVRLTQDVLLDIRDPGGQIGPEAGNDFYTATDAGVTRHRRLYMPLEQASDPAQFTKRKADWDQARRIGRSRIATATVDSWRDAAGRLWLPNTLVDVSLPGIPEGASRLCIAQVTFNRDDRTGTTATLTMMDPRAFTPEPFSLLQANLSDVTRVPDELLGVGAR